LSNVLFLVSVFCCDFALIYRELSGSDSGIASIVLLGNIRRIFAIKQTRGTIRDYTSTHDYSCVVSKRFVN
tara:strand:+ start:709 stop:921 length:213 start_codon:yes stop_codon:yes gene_type:complete